MKRIPRFSIVDCVGAKTIKPKVTDYFRRCTKCSKVYFSPCFEECSECRESEAADGANI